MTSTTKPASAQRAVTSSRFAPTDSDRFTPADDGGRNPFAFYFFMIAVAGGLVALAAALVVL